MESQDTEWLLKEKYGGTESEAFRADCVRLDTGEPLAYVIGSVPFLNTTIYLDSHPLIPRSETEFWTEKAITEIQKVASAKVLDLCAGSGAIGVAVTKAMPEALVDCSEIDARHLPTIEKNFSENGIDSTHYRVWQSDLFANISDRYDFILTNPPYIDPKLDRTETSVTEFEPPHALYGGQLGLEYIEHIIATAPQFLNQNGQLWVEHEPEQACAVYCLGLQNNLMVQPQLDQFGVVRYSILQKIHTH